MTPRERLAATLLDVAPELTPVQYEVIMGAAGEYAAAMIERHAHPPYRTPLRIDVGHARAAAGKGTLAVTESAQGVTGAQDGAA